MAELVKKSNSSNEIFVKVADKKVYLIKNSNTYKVDGEIKYLNQIIWEEKTDSIIKEIEEQLSK